MRKRADVILVERGLAATRSQAQALVLAGLVAGIEKPGQQVPEDVELVVSHPARYVSRGGEKLAHGLAALGVVASGRDCLDLGTSTGGFTDCLLQAGARRVVAVDVGYGQLHPRLRDDPRVLVLERVNARHLRELPIVPELVTCDVSFISATAVLPAALRLCAPAWEAVVLVKPQFEAGRSEVRKGVVRDPSVHRAVLAGFAARASDWSGAVYGVVDSGLRGPKGNREFFVHLRASEEATSQDDVDRWIDDAVDRA